MAVHVTPRSACQVLPTTEARVRGYLGLDPFRRLPLTEVSSDIRSGLCRDRLLAQLAFLDVGVETNVVFIPQQPGDFAHRQTQAQ